MEIGFMSNIIKKLELDSFESWYRVRKNKIIFNSICCSLICLCIIISAMVRFDLFRIYTAKRLEKKLATVSDIQVPGDGTVSFKVDGYFVEIYTDPKKSNYYTKVNGNIVPSSFEEFISTAYFNEVEAAPNSQGNFLYYIVNNDTGDYPSQEYKSAKASCRYSAVEDGYLLEFHNDNANKGSGLVYFNEKGDLNVQGIYDRYVNADEESFQIYVTSDFDYETLAKSLVNYLSNL